MNFTNVKEITIPEGKVLKITSDDRVLWSAGLLPSAYQRVEYVQADADVGAYIDLGFAFDTAATVYLTQYSRNTTVAYPFGATNAGGGIRCCISCPYGGASAYTYGCNGSTYISVSVDIKLAIFNEIKAVWKNGYLHSTNLSTSVEGKTLTSQTAYTMTEPLYLFAQNYKGAPRFGGMRQISKFQYYDKNDVLICDMIPCYRKSDGVIGMYDVVRRQFFTNIGTGSFEKGADVGFVNLAEPNDTNTTDYSIWINDARMGSDATYRSSTNSMVTNYILVSENEEEETTLYFAGTGLTSAGNGVTAGCCIVLYYGNDKIKWAGFNTISGFLETYTRCSAAYYDDGTLKSMTFKVGNGIPPYHIRFCLSNTLDKSKIIISKEPIE